MAVLAVYSKKRESHIFKICITLYDSNLSAPLLFYLILTIGIIENAHNWYLSSYQSSKHWRCILGHNQTAWSQAVTEDFNHNWPNLVYDQNFCEAPPSTDYWLTIKTYLIEMGELLQSSVVYLAVVTLNKQGLEDILSK